MAARLFLLFIIAPIIELFVLIKIGSLLGVVPTVAIVLITAFIGSQLVRQQGLDVMGQVRTAQARGEVPTLPILNGIALLLAGFLLITPGFISDTLGFTLLIPKLRQYLARQLLERVTIITPSGSSTHRRDQHTTIEGEYYRKKNGQHSSESRQQRPLDQDK